nr:unnamed protein product [Digitaria exilis]
MSRLLATPVVHLVHSRRLGDDAARVRHQRTHVGIKQEASSHNATMKGRNQVLSAFWQLLGILKSTGGKGVSTLHELKGQPNAGSLLGNAAPPRDD